MLPFPPFNTQTVIAMSSRRARSAPATRLATEKFEIVANRTAYTSYLTGSCAGAAANLASARTRKHPIPPIQPIPPFRPMSPSQFFQRSAEHLAHHRLRQIGAKLHTRRHLVRGQPLAAERAQLRLRGGVAAAEDHPRFHRF